MIYDRFGTANFRVLIPTNKFLVRVISPVKWNFMGDGNYKKIHK